MTHLRNNALPEVKFGVHMVGFKHLHFLLSMKHGAGDRGGLVIAQ